MNVIVLTQPSVEPVTLEEVRDHLRLVTDDDSPPTHPHDSMLERHITTARIEAEQITHRAFVQQRLLLTTNRFPACCYSRSASQGYIELLRPPVQEVLSVSYYDSDNVLRLVDPDDYFATDDFVPRLVFGAAFTPPDIYVASDSIRIEYLAGYEPSDDSPPDYRAEIPAPIKDAVLIGVEMLYRSQDTKNLEVLTQRRDALLDGFIVHALA